MVGPKFDELDLIFTGDMRKYRYGISCFSNKNLTLENVEFNNFQKNWINLSQINILIFVYFRREIN